PRRAECPRKAECPRRAAPAGRTPAATLQPGPVTAAALRAAGEMAAPAAPRASPAGATAGPAVAVLTPGGPAPQRAARTFPAARVRTRRSRPRSPRVARSGCSTPLRPWTAERTWRPAPARAGATTSPRSAATTHAPAVRAGSTSAATATPVPAQTPNLPRRLAL